MCLYFFLAQITTHIVKHYPPMKGIIMFDKNWNEDDNIIESGSTRNEIKTILYSLASVSVVVSLINLYFITVIAK
jgi:hypothetical protein